MHILFVTATRIGDAVLSTGLLAYVIERFPGARLTIAAGPVAAPLFAAVPRIEPLSAARKQRGGLHWRALFSRTPRRRWAPATLPAATPAAWGRCAPAG